MEFKISGGYLLLGYRPQGPHLVRMLLHYYSLRCDYKLNHGKNASFMEKVVISCG